MTATAGSRALAQRRIDLIERLAQAAQARAHVGLGRRLRVRQAGLGTRIVFDGRELLNFASNDYLGLAAHPAVIAALIEGARRDGVGAGAAHLLGGHRAIHEQLDEALAAWTGRARALSFSSGWLANLGALTALLEPGDLCLQDQLNHACLLDGARLAGATLKRYRHGDLDRLARLLDAESERPALIASDGVFSMDGDRAPLVEIANLATARGASLMVDDAHGIGVLGPRGAGSVAAAGLGTTQVPVLMATFGKALGTSGAFVAGSAALIDGLTNFARSFVYSTALAPPLAHATLAAIRVAQVEAWRREQLARLARHFRRGAQARGLALVADADGPIQPLIVGAADAALTLARALADAGFYVPAIRPPTVRPGSARLRVTLSALHRESEVEALLDALARHWPQVTDAN